MLMHLSTQMESEEDLFKVGMCLPPVLMYQMTMFAISLTVLKRQS